MSHTATEQWQSFEMRMRHRRAERCRLRAEVAAQQGCYEDAVAALAEACRLEPDAPENAAIERLLAPPASAPDAPSRRRPTWTWLAGAALLIVGAGAGVGALLSQRPSAVPASDAAHAPLSGSVPQGDPAATTVRPVSTLTVAHTAGEQDTTAPGDVPADSAQTQPGNAPQPTATSGASGASPLPEVEAASAPATVPPEPVGVSSPEATGSLPAPPPPAPVVAAVSDPPARMPGEVVAMPPPAASSETLNIRTVLGKYEAAYSSLDAAAAVSVWPGVDGRALARAFENLESQRVSLGDCNVTITGVTAHAECSGMTTWTPKVGGGRRTQPHSWSFDLAKQDEGWLIQSANIK